MAKKRSATQRSIDSINRNLRNIAATFGTQSRQYEAATMDIFRFKVRTNKDGVIQLQNAKANKKFHQSIRARRKNNLNIRKSKAASQAAMERYNKNKNSKSQYSSIKAFEERQKALDDLTEKVYEAQEMALENDIDFNAYEAFKNPSYLFDKLQEIDNELYAEDESDVRSTDIVYNEEGNAVLIDTDTGEVLFEYD